MRHFIPQNSCVFSSLNALGTQQAVSLFIPEGPCIVVDVLPYEMPNAFAISST